MAESSTTRIFRGAEFSGEGAERVSDKSLRLSELTSLSYSWNPASKGSRGGLQAISLSLERPGRGAGECREHRRAPTDPVTTGKLLARRTVVYRRHHEGFPHGRGTDIRWESSIFQESRRLLFSSPIENRSARCGRKSGQM